jgi:hypothetical protein
MASEGSGFGCLAIIGIAQFIGITVWLGVVLKADEFIVPFILSVMLVGGTLFAIKKLTASRTTLGKIPAQMVVGVVAVLAAIYVDYDLLFGSARPKANVGAANEEVLRAPLSSAAQRRSMCAEGCAIGSMEEQPEFRSVYVDRCVAKCIEP